MRRSKRFFKNWIALRIGRESQLDMRQIIKRLNSVAICISKWCQTPYNTYRRHAEYFCNVPYHLTWIIFNQCFDLDIISNSRPARTFTIIHIKIHTSEYLRTAFSAMEPSPKNSTHFSACIESLIFIFFHSSLWTWIKDTLKCYLSEYETKLHFQRPPIANLKKMLFQSNNLYK